MPVDTLRENDEIVRALQGAVHDGGHGLQIVPALIKRVIREERWRERYSDVLYRAVAFQRFTDFVTHHPPEGMGATLDMVKRMCGDDPDALDLIDMATTNPKHVHLSNSASDGSNRTITSEKVKRGTTAQYAIRKLRKDRPDLHAAVMDRKMSPHAAMVEAGFRPKTISVNLQSPESAAAAIRKHADAAFIADLVAALTDAGAMSGEG